MIIYLISPFQNYGIIFYKAEADFWCADVAQVGFRLVSVRNGFTNFKLLTLVELLTLLNSWEAHSTFERVLRKPIY